ncbi:MAG: FAD:protein FMN transferase [Actinobacteria bacterium]|nr:FAD:protein FMN transferase [Actinomycetota bacterium]
MRRVEQVMGLPVAIDVRDERVSGAAVDAAFCWLKRVDSLFSTYRRDSQIARLNRGELSEEDAEADVREVLAACRRLRERTGGAFDAEAAARAPGARNRIGCADGRSGAVEPAGYVKGWAIDGAWDVLWVAGARNAVVDGGGDVIVRGRPEPDRAWRVGIQHPLIEDRVAAVLEPGEACVATSGAYRRGAHIVDPRRGGAADAVLSVTCVACDLATADALATAGFAMGRSAAGWLARQPDVEAMVIDDSGRTLTTPGFDALRVDAPRKVPGSPRRAPSSDIDPPGVTQVERSSSCLPAGR